uniref:Uncharacterized protein LOC116950837 n=1 Tax=Petromyzon marinus TaxID=7757 RepID=A0AAJ7TXK2_PETMA|nr:uncharacterized protein LOC116950837 [Petromyzon marinus]
MEEVAWWLRDTDYFSQITLPASTPSLCGRTGESLSRDLWRCSERWRATFSIRVSEDAVGEGSEHRCVCGVCVCGRLASFIKGLLARKRGSVSIQSQVGSAVLVNLLHAALACEISRSAPRATKSNLLHDRKSRYFGLRNVVGESDVETITSWKRRECKREEIQSHSPCGRSCQKQGGKGKHPMQVSLWAFVTHGASSLPPAASSSACPTNTREGDTTTDHHRPPPMTSTD